MVNPFMGAAALRRRSATRGRVLAAQYMGYIPDSRMIKHGWPQLHYMAIYVLSMSSEIINRLMRNDCSAMNLPSLIEDHCDKEIEILAIQVSDDAQLC